MGSPQQAEERRYPNLLRPQKGSPRVGGRAAGTPNKWNGDIKRMVCAALELAGGVQYLCDQAHKNPVAFMGLVGRVLPLQVTGANGGPVQITIGIDRPPEITESREEWIARRKAELVLLDGPVLKSSDASKDNG